MFINLRDKISKFMENKDDFTTMISSYIMSISIILSSIFIGIDIINDFHEISTSNVTLYVIILGHHLFLLGIKRSYERNKYDSNYDLSEIEIKKLNKK